MRGLLVLERRPDDAGGWRRRELFEQTGQLRAARRDARLRFERGDDVEIEPVREVTEAAVMRHEAHAGERLRALFPAFAGVVPAPQEIVRIGPVGRGIGRVEFCQPVGKRFGDALDVARVQVYVRVALRVHVTLRTIDIRRDLDAPHVVRCEEMAGAAGLYVRVARASQEQRQPADLEVGAGADQQVRAAGPRDQARSCLQHMRILERGRRLGDPGIVAGQFLDQRGPLRFAAEHVQRACRDGQPQGKQVRWRCES